MSGDDLLENIKSPIWLGGKPFNIPLAFLKDPPDLFVHRPSIKFGYLQDEFELVLSKSTNDRIIASIFRKRQNPREAPDDGYVLRFYFTIVGIDEETKVVFMRHDQEHVCKSFVLTPITIDRLESPTSYIDIFVVAQMLEIKSLDASDRRKMFVDEVLSRVKGRLTTDGAKQLDFILNRPGLDDHFTGRMAPPDFKQVMVIATRMMEYYASIVAYNKAKAKNKDIPKPDFDMGKQLNYVAIGNKDNTIAPLDAVRQFMIAHCLGLNFYRKLVFDYLMKIIDKNFIILDMLEAAIVLRDEELLDRAVPYFLLNFYEIMDSERFASFSKHKGYVTRLIMHEAQRWVLNKGVYIPGWKKRTEL